MLKFKISFQVSTLGLDIFLVQKMKVTEPYLYSIGASTFL